MADQTLLYRSVVQRGLTGDVPGSARAPVSNRRGVAAVQRIAQQRQLRHFCRAKANQLFTSASSRVSTFRSIGLCSREQGRGYPQFTFADDIFNLRVFLAQIGAPDVAALISPAESSQSAGRRLCSSATSSWPWTRSTCRPCTAVR